MAFVETYEPLPPTEFLDATGRLDLERLTRHYNRMEPWQVRAVVYDSAEQDRFLLCDNGVVVYMRWARMEPALRANYSAHRAALL